MKTIFTLFISLIMGVAVLAAPADKMAKPKSTLTIRSVDRGDIRVIIDGRRFEPGDNYMRIRAIESGFHTIKIYRERTTGFFTIFGMKYEMVFSKSIRLQPQASVTINIDRFGRASVSEKRSTGFNGRDDNGFGNNGGYGNRDDRNSDIQDGGVWDKNHDLDFDRGNNYGDYDSRDSKWGGSRDGRSGGRDDRDYNDNGYSKAMSDFEFQRVMTSMEKEWYENNKMKSASQIISTSFFTTVQVKQILQLFSFENNKLDLAKQAYAKTVDQKNYFMINDLFRSSSSKEELARFIRSH